MRLLVETQFDINYIFFKLVATKVRVLLRALYTNGFRKEKKEWFDSMLWNTNLNILLAKLVSYFFSVKAFGNLLFLIAA